MKIKHRVMAWIEKIFYPKHRLRFKCTYYFEHYDKDGNLKGKYTIQNDVTNEGRNNILDVAFHAATQITTWYIGLIDNSGFTIEALVDTLASHTGWNEFTTYSGNRKEWTEGAASGQIITNSSPISFTITAAGILQGTFLASVATGTSGKLWGTSLFNSPVTVAIADVLKCVYTIDLN